MSTLQDEKEAPSAEMDEDIIIDSSEPEEVTVEPTEEEQIAEVGATEETENEVVEDVKENVQKEEPEPRVPYKRVKKLSDKVRELSMELEKYKTQPQESKQTEQFKPRPKEADFNYDPVKYNEAVEKWEDERLEYKLEQRERARQAEQQKARVKELQSKFTENASQLFETDAEYRNALIQADEDGEDLRIPAIVSETMLESEVGHLIERELVVNREEYLPRLRSMTERQQLVFLGRIEAQIQSRQDMGKQQPKRTQAVVSKAPKPQTDVKASSGKIDSDAEMKKLYPDFQSY